MYFIEKNINKLKRGEQTLFLNEIEYKKILSIIPKNTYNIFYPFIDSNKYIIYKERLEIKLYEIILNGTIKHSDILGSLLRSDNLISKLIKTSRDIVKDMIKDKLIRINYELLNKSSYIIKENDIISIRKYGKYRFIGIIKETKKDNYLIEVNKYK